ncbi:MAG: hypothetical protein R3E08_11870 [Thiotrichaceae bacterium]
MQIYLISRQLMLAQRISNTIEKSFKGEIDNNKFLMLRANWKAMSK